MGGGGPSRHGRCAGACKRACGEMLSCSGQPAVSFLHQRDTPRESETSPPAACQQAATHVHAAQAVQIPYGRCVKAAGPTSIILLCRTQPRIAVLPHDGFQGCRWNRVLCSHSGLQDEIWSLSLAVRSVSIAQRPQHIALPPLWPPRGAQHIALPPCVATSTSLRSWSSEAAGGFQMMRPSYWSMPSA